MQQPRTLCHRIVDSALEELGRVNVDDRAHVDLGVQRIAIGPALCLGQKRVCEVTRHFFVHKDALHRRATLAGIFVRTTCGQVGSPDHIGVVHHHDGVVATKFQHLAFVDGFCGDVFADGHTAGEGDDVNHLVGQHLIGNLFGVARDDAQHLWGQARFVQHVGQQERRQRCFLSGLEDHPVVGGHRRRHLVDDLVERVVEGRDGRYHAHHRLAQGVYAALLAVVGEVARKRLPIVDQSLLRREQQHIAGAAYFIQRVLDAQTRFECDDARHLVQAAGDDLAGFHQNFVALVACQLGLVLVRDAQRPPHVINAGLGHRGDDLTGVRVADLDDTVAVDLFTANAHAFSLGRINDIGSGAHWASFWLDIGRRVQAARAALPGQSSSMGGGGKTLCCGQAQSAPLMAKSKT